VEITVGVFDCIGVCVGEYVYVIVFVCVVSSVDDVEFFREGVIVNVRV
jgi:hypothetical protein